LNKDRVPREIDGVIKTTMYFGLDESFTLCEDLGAEPVYTTSAGISEVPASKKGCSLPAW